MQLIHQDEKKKKNLCSAWLQTLLLFNLEPEFEIRKCIFENTAASKNIGTFYHLNVCSWIVAASGTSCVVVPTHSRGLAAIRPCKAVQSNNAVKIVIQLIMFKRANERREIDFKTFVNTTALVITP